MQNYSLQEWKCSEVKLVEKYYSTCSAGCTPLITIVYSDGVSPDDVMPIFSHSSPSN